MGRIIGEMAARVRGRPWGRNATRLAILEAARRIAACDGASAVSLSRTADEAGFARPTVYGHFRNKEELLVSVVADDLETLSRLIRKGAEAPQEEAAPAEEPIVEQVQAETTEEIPSTEEQSQPVEFTSEEIFTAIGDAQPEEIVQPVFELTASEEFSGEPEIQHEEEVQAPEPEDAPSLWQEAHEPVAETDAGETAIESAPEEAAPEPQPPEENLRGGLRQPAEPPRVDAWLERRLRVFEHTLTEISKRMDKAERASEHAEGLVAEGMRDIQQHLDAAEARAKEAADNLLRRVEAVDQRNLAAIATIRAELLRVGGFDAPQPLAHEDKLTFIPTPPEEPKAKSEPSDSFLDAARRAATAAAELAETDKSTPIVAGIKWPANDDARKRYTRYIISGVAVLALTLIGAGIFLRHGADDVKSMSAVPKITPAEARTMPGNSQAPLDRLTQLANSGDAEAELIVGLKYMQGGGSESSAAQWLERSANAHNAVAQYMLGTLYENGHGVGKDASQAAHWYQQAAEAGNRKAMYRLGIAYAQGDGVTQDYAQAANWFEKAANAGLVDAQFNLAVLYERGEGVPQSLLDAYKWYAIAASHGDKESASRVEALAAQLTPDDLQVAEKSVQDFAPADFDREANLAPTIGDVAGP
jgi:AcrR family transcriptional regulator